MAIEIYCVKCKANTDSTNVESVTLKNGQPPRPCAWYAALASTVSARRQRRRAEPGRASDDKVGK